MKAVINSLINIAVVGVAIAGLGYDVGWADNITRFYAICCAVVAGIMVLFGTEQARRDIAKAVKTPAVFSVGSDLVLIVLFAATNHFGYAGGMFVSMAFTAHLYALQREAKA